ncbi:MAG: hypothetical protein FJZ56_07440 [Chlamydiae bacterium]|nr:hypothetical protein [Chlamydiota bacterium]
MSIKVSHAVLNPLPPIHDHEEIERVSSALIKWWHDHTAIDTANSSSSLFIIKSIQDMISGICHPYTEVTTETKTSFNQISTHNLETLGAFSKKIHEIPLSDLKKVNRSLSRKIEEIRSDVFAAQHIYKIQYGVLKYCLDELPNSYNS